MGYYNSLDVQGSNIWASNPVTGFITEVQITEIPGLKEVFLAQPYQIQDMDFFNENVGYAVGCGRTSISEAAMEELPGKYFQHQTRLINLQIFI